MTLQITWRHQYSATDYLKIKFLWNGFIIWSTDLHYTSPTSQHPHNSTKLHWMHPQQCNPTTPLHFTELHPQICIALHPQYSAVLHCAVLTTLHHKIFKLHCMVQWYTLHCILRQFTSAALHFMVQCYTVHCISLHGAVLYTVQHFATIHQHCAPLHFTARSSAALHCSPLRPTPLHRTERSSVLHSTSPHNYVLHCSHFLRKEHMHLHCYHDDSH